MNSPYKQLWDLLLKGYGYLIEKQNNNVIVQIKLKPN